MKKSVKNFKLTENYKGHIILVYGELWEEGYVDGIVIRRAKFSKDGRKVMDESVTSEDILLNRPYTRTRYFNMGWAICTPDDKYNEQYGIELCKRRFRKSPLKTETGLFLTKDMVHALLRNEIHYIENNWKKFAPKSKDIEDNGYDVNKEPVTGINKEPVNRFPKFHCDKKWTSIRNKKGENNIPVENGENKNDFQKFKPGDYVRIFKPEIEGWPVTIGCVKSVDEKNVYLSWVVKHGVENGVEYSSYNRISGLKSLYYNKKYVQRASKSEANRALNYIQNLTWDY